MAVFAVLRSTFDLTQTPAVIVFEDITDYNASDLNESTALGYIKVTSPSGVVLKDFDLNTADIDPDVARVSTSTVEIPLVGNGDYEQGDYIIEYQVTDDETTVTQKDTTCFDYSSPTVKLTVEYDCAVPYLTSTDETSYQVDTILPEISRTHKLYYPAGLGASDISVTSSVLKTGILYSEPSVGAQHRASLVADLEYHFSDIYYVLDQIEGEKLENIICSQAICAIQCLLKAKYLEFETAKSRSGVRAKELLWEYVLMVCLSSHAAQAEKCGDSRDVSKYLQEIQNISDCEDCNSAEVGVITLVTGIGGASGGGTASITGSTFITVLNNDGEYVIQLSQAAANKLNSLKNTKVVGESGITVTETILGDLKTYKVKLSGSASMGLGPVLANSNTTAGQSILLNKANGGANRVRSASGAAYLEAGETIPVFAPGNPGDPQPLPEDKWVMVAPEGEFDFANKVTISGDTASVKIDENGFTLISPTGSFRFPSLADVSGMVAVPTNGGVAWDSNAKKLKLYSTTWQNIATEQFVLDSVGAGGSSGTLAEVLANGNDTDGQYIVMGDGDISGFDNRLVHTSNRATLYFQSVSPTNVRTTLEGDTISLKASLEVKIYTAQNDIVLQRASGIYDSSVRLSAAGFIIDTSINNAFYLPPNADPLGNVAPYREGGMVYDTGDDKVSVYSSAAWKTLAYTEEVLIYDVVGGTNVTVTANTVGNTTTFTVNSSAGVGGAGFSPTGLDYDPVTRVLTLTTDEPNAFTDTLDVTFNNVVTSGNTWSAADLVSSYDGSNVSKKWRDADNKSYVRFVRTPFFTSYINNIEIVATGGGALVQSSTSSRLKYVNAADAADTAEVAVGIFGTLVSGKQLVLPSLTAAQVPSPLGGALRSEYDSGTGLFSLKFYDGQNWKNVTLT